MKTLAEIMNEPANIEAIIREAEKINEMLKEVKNMPELEDPIPTVPSWFYEEPPQVVQT